MEEMRSKSALDAIDMDIELTHPAMMAESVLSEADSDYDKRDKSEEESDHGPISGKLPIGLGAGLAF